MTRENPIKRQSFPPEAPGADEIRDSSRERTTAADPLITLRGVSKVYQPKKKRPVVAVEEIDLSIDRGQFVIITGRSGSGKTTLLNLVSGLTRPTAGEVLLEDAAVWRLPDAEQSQLRNRRLGFVFQFPSLMPTLTSLENVMLPTIMEPAEQKAAIRERAEHLLRQVGLADKLDAYPRQLSGGQQQRVVIARSLINEPDLLLADEPTSDLDEKTEHEIMALIQQIHEEMDFTILLVTHSRELAAFGNRALRMAAGRIV
jgi:ABC-type lipoprotein export system ATPase subunit